MTPRAPDTPAIQWYTDFAHGEYPHAVALARRLLYDAHLPRRDAEDIVQEAFLIAFQKLALISVHPNPRGWIFKTVHLIFKNYYRKMQPTFSNVPLDEDIPNLYAPTPEDTILLRDLIDSAARELSPHDYALYRSVYFLGLTTQQIAQQSDQKPDTVMRQISRMNERLRNFLICLSENDDSRHNVDERSSRK